MKIAAASARPIWPRDFVKWLALVVASIAFGMALALSNIAQPLSNALYDGLSKRLLAAPGHDVVIVAIDDASIDAVGHWPWPRPVHAAMIDRIAAAHPRAIVYDVLFTEPENARGDAALAAAIHRAAGRVVLPAITEIPGRDGAEFSVKLPLPALRAAGARVGHSNIAVDHDGVLRRVALTDVGLRHIAAVAVGAPSTPNTATAMIAFAEQGAFRTIPFAALARGDVPAEFLRDRIVIVGATAAGLGDRYATPLTSGAGLTPGVETIGAIASDLRGHRLIADFGWRGSLAFVVPALACLGLAFRRLTPLRSALVMLLLIASCLGVATVSLRAGTWLDPVPAMLAMSLFFPVWGWYRLATVSGFIDGQLDRLAADRGPLDAGHARAGTSDRLGWRTALLDRSIGRMRDLRAFVDSSFDNLPDATLVIDRRGRIVIASAQAHAIFRFYCDAPLPRSARAALRTLAPHISTGHDAFPALDAGAVAIGEAREVTLRDERCFQVETNRFQATSTAASFTILRLSDITPRKRAERDRQRALEFLSHDIRAPQTTLLAMVAGLDERLDHTTRTGITRVAQRTLSLAQSFVDIARAQSGTLHMAPTDMIEVLRDSVDLLWNDFRARGLQVRLSVPDHEALVLADGLLLARAFQNVLTNAARHAPEGSDIRIRVIARPGPGAAGSWVCKIDDSGPGIAPATLGALFLRFESGRRQAGGTGLGLSLVRTVCRAFGGDVTCYSRPGIGTRFAMTLPRSAEDTAANA